MFSILLNSSVANIFVHFHWNILASNVNVLFLNMKYYTSMLPLHLKLFLQFYSKQFGFNINKFYTAHVFWTLYNNPSHICSYKISNMIPMINHCQTSHNAIRPSSSFCADIFGMAETCKGYWCAVWMFAWPPRQPMPVWTFGSAPRLVALLLQSSWVVTHARRAASGRQGAATSTVACHCTTIALISRSRQLSPTLLPPAWLRSQVRLP